MVGISKLSIIVPVYKVEKYLRQCIESILGQTLSEFELILVDDGSPDRCGDICDEYAERDRRVRVIHKKNGGLVSAWSAGVLAAQAPYIGFVDSDDWIEPDMYETLYRCVLEENADIVACGLCMNFPGHELRVGRIETEIFEGSQVLGLLVPQLLTNWSFENPRILNARCDKLFRRELIIENMHFCDLEISAGEDLSIVFAALLDAKKVVCVGNKYLYHYRKGVESITFNYNPRLWHNNVTLINALQIIAVKKDFHSKELNLHACFVYYQAICSECLSKRSLNEKINSVKLIMQSLPRNYKFTNLREQFLTGGACSKNRELSLLLLSYGMWRVWVIGTHIMRKTKILI